jgi:hypothetical protein
MRTFLAVAALCLLGCVELPETNRPHAEYRVYTSSQGIRYICPVKTGCLWTIDECTLWKQCHSQFQPGKFPYMVESDDGRRFHVYQKDDHRVFCHTLETCSDRDRRRYEEMFCGNIHACVMQKVSVEKPASEEKIPRPSSTPVGTAPTPI